MELEIYRSAYFFSQNSDQFLDTHYGMPILQYASDHESTTFDNAIYDGTDPKYVCDDVL